MLFKDTWKFRRSALEFMNEGVYTKETKNPNPVSKYMRFWQEEIRRSLYGYTVDNTTITGYHYFYLNYCPILKAQAVNEESKISEEVDYIAAERVESFPNFWDGDYEWFHHINEAEKVGLHAIGLKARTKGFSFKSASMCNRNYYLIPNSKSYVYAYDMQYLTGDGILDKAWMMMDFIDTHTAWGRRRSINQALHKRAGYKEKDDRGKEVEKGFKSEIFGISINDGWKKVRGKRGKLIVWEESGANPYLLKGWNVALNSMKSGIMSFGLMLAQGTGGEEDADIMALSEMFYNSGYGIYHVPNIYDEGHENSKCGFFFPMWKNLEGFMDADGNSNEAAAKEYLLKQREDMKAQTKDINAIIRKMAEEPLTPREALMRVGGNFFPINELNEILADLVSDNKTRDAEYIGKIELASDGTTTWRPDDTLRPIRDFPLKYDGDNVKDKEGCIVIWEMPYKNADGIIPSGMYLSACLTPGERVMTDNGMTNVEDVVLEDRLINENGNYVAINRIITHYVENKDIYTFKMSNTYSTTTFTEEHPLLVSKPFLKCDLTVDENRFNFNYVSAKDIKIGDWIKVPNVYKKIMKNDINILWDNEEYRIDRLIDSPMYNEDFWWFIGVWLGNGWCDNKQYKISISFNKDAIDCIKRCRSIVENIFKRNIYCKILESNCVEIEFSFRQLNRFLTDNFGKYSYGKYIPEWAKFINEDCKKQLILGYLDTDGCVTKHTKGYCSVEFVSVNLELLESIQDILFSLGIISALSILRDKSVHKIVNNKPCNTLPCYHLRLAHHSSVGLKKIYKEINSYKLSKIDIDCMSNIRKQPKDGCFFDKDMNYIYFKVREIENKKYTGIVYNYECETHTFMCHHITTHNCDPYDQDEATNSDSLGSTFILNKITDRIVAEYTGRPNTANQYYENVRRLLLFYNARCNYENNLKGLFSYLDNKHSAYLLTDTPKIIYDKIDDKAVLQRKKGTPGTLPIKKYGLELYKDWLLSPNQADGKQNMYSIKSIPLLKETIYFSLKNGNYDRVMSMVYLMIQREEAMKITVDPENKIKTMADDPFWKKHYNTLNRGNTKFI